MDIVEKATLFAKKEYLKNDPKHQWNHIEAVMKRALEISNQVGVVDFELLKLAIIFHDIDYNSESTYESNYNNHVENSVKVAEEFLMKNNYPKEKIIRLKQVMLDHSTPHRLKCGDSKTKEGKIIYDADKSIFLTNMEQYEKYYPLLYFDETRSLVKKPAS
ncbi:MAG: HD domain-containing protein [Candidatus Woesearchaeota archaeon]